MISECAAPAPGGDQREAQLRDAQAELGGPDGGRYQGVRIAYRMVRGLVCTILCTGNFASGLGVWPAGQGQAALLRVATEESHLPASERLGELSDVGPGPGGVRPVLDKVPSC